MPFVYTGYLVGYCPLTTTGVQGSLWDDGPQDTELIGKLTEGQLPPSLLFTFSFRDMLADLKFWIIICVNSETH